LAAIWKFWCQSNPSESGPTAVDRFEDERRQGWPINIGHFTSASFMSNPFDLNGGQRQNGTMELPTRGFSVLAHLHPGTPSVT
jgi:hypothetical protein